MRRSGELVQWNDGRGFGFVRDNDGKRYFVHISSIRRARARPQQGNRLTFDPASDEVGRSVAQSVVLLDVAPAARTPPPGSVHAGGIPVGLLPRLFGAALIILAALAATQLRLAPTWVLIAYLVLGIVSIGLYWADKRAAEGGRWRIAENSLHLADLIGGIAGGLVAQALLRHKVRKPAFWVYSWLIATMHFTGLVLVSLGFWRFPPVLWPN
ncbi:DUF1294 domain-containing protein [Devosia sp.]|uniref:DUF1294 domain-containing protein n=1 Tax=Devosia sp. TaxID=1871048 RepID=UPI001AD2023E|nr:DUF1294 domain-containing protein [Devosia sp.]MBN9308665.1 cold shock and DUF1294 domain-containing protein [Devosia sp.]